MYYHKPFHLHSLVDQKGSWCIKWLKTDRMDRSEPDQHKHTQPERNMNERQFINDRALLMPQALLL